ncbi:MAG: methyltransferase, partial [Rhodobacteraceae bacterium CG17_big_fil_post_rev_8_21_14_2_50_63_15]
MSETQSRRAGGRAARREARSNPLAAALRPVHPGQEGGTYRPLSPAQMDRIHLAVLDALEQIGLADAPASGVAYLTGAGAILGSDGRIRFPRALIEDTIAKANKSITLYGRDPRHDMILSGNRVHYGTAGAAVHVVEVETRTYRESTVQDLHDATRIADQLDNIHFVQRPMVCRDIPDNREMDLNTVYACCAGTTKHVGTSFTEPAFARDAMEMLHLMAGGEDKWRERPFVSNSNCFVVPPMKFAHDACLVMEECIRGGMP